ncbi:acylphosphatase-2-like [Anopheles maculipalpis]|uniref:acylphosphatase-2-like n=1 Tax=Anopheles maculipalpis TaxID=1496333 RepID=UPI002158B384|nr:acylphosphatase-2-like [Anopheles maculipalpis]
MITHDLLFIFISFATIIATYQRTDGIVCGTSEIEGQIAEDNCASTLCADHPTPQLKMSTKLFACDFEVFGIVQGVFFRKYTQKQASSLGLRGWCMNTRDDTVKGQLEGEEKAMNEMKYWLQTKGSPSSRIDKAVFSVPKEIVSYSFKDFSIRR